MIEEHLQEILNTPPLALDEILSARERRADTQRQLLEEGQGTLICLTLNIAGAVKSAPLFTKAFEEGKSRILTQLRFERAKIGKCIERHERTGDELYLLVDLDLVTAKRRMVEIEEGFALGRLLDIDVMAKGAPKISRQQLGLPPRRCLVCGEMAAACARSRRHDIREILRRTVELIDGYFVGEYADRVAGHAAGRCCMRCTSRQSRDWWTGKTAARTGTWTSLPFLTAPCALYPYFRECAKKGALYREEPGRPLCAAADGRQAGRAADAARHRRGQHPQGSDLLDGDFLCGDGEHDGGRLWESAFAARCKALCRDLLRDFEGLEQKENISYGERLYRDYGITGIRGEAAQGFPSVLQVGLPALREGSEAGQKPQRRCAGCPAAADPGGAGHQYPHPLRPPNAAMGAAAGREGTGTGCRPRADAGAGPRLYCAQPKPRRLRRPAGAELVFVFYGPISGWFCPA